MKKEFILQDRFLNSARMSGTPVTVYLVNGFQLRGNVEAFDSFTVLFTVDGRQQLVYKHAISTVVPARNLAMQGDNV